MTGSDIFLSYEKSDVAKAKQLADAFRARGWSVWWDHKIPPGENWADFIEHHIRSSRCVVVLWSTTSVGSKWVKKESRLAERRSRLIPVFIDRVEPPFEFEHIEAANLIDWTGEPTDGFAELSATLDSILAPALVSDSLAAAPIEGEGEYARKSMREATHDPPLEGAVDLPLELSGASNDTVAGVSNDAPTQPAPEPPVHAPVETAATPSATKPGKKPLSRRAKAKREPRKREPTKRADPRRQTRRLPPRATETTPAPHRRAPATSSAVPWRATTGGRLTSYLLVIALISGLGIAASMATNPLVVALRPYMTKGAIGRWLAITWAPAVTALGVELIVAIWSWALAADEIPVDLTDYSKVSSKAIFGTFILAILWVILFGAAFPTGLLSHFFVIALGTSGGTVAVFALLDEL